MTLVKLCKRRSLCRWGHQSWSAGRSRLARAQSPAPWQSPSSILQAFSWLVASTLDQWSRPFSSSFLWRKRIAPRRRVGLGGWVATRRSSWRGRSRMRQQPWSKNWTQSGSAGVNCPSPLPWSSSSLDSTASNLLSATGLQWEPSTLQRSTMMTTATSWTLNSLCVPRWRSQLFFLHVSKVRSQVVCLTLPPGHVMMNELPPTVLATYFGGEDPQRPSQNSLQRIIFGAHLEEKEGLAITKTWPGYCRIDMLAQIGSRDLQLTRAMVKSDLMMGNTGSEKRRRKGAYRGLNVITFKMLDWRRTRRRYDMLCCEQIWNTFS